MKISTAKLKQLIREELFYREFYRGTDALNEDHDDERDAEILEAQAEAELDASRGEGPAVGYKAHQNVYDRAYVDTMVSMVKGQMADQGLVYGELIGDGSSARVSWSVIENILVDIVGFDNYDDDSVIFNNIAERLIGSAVV